MSQIAVQHQPKIDLNQASQFIQALQGNRSKVCFQAFSDRQKCSHRTREAGCSICEVKRCFYGTVENSVDKLEALQLKEAGLFVTVNPTDGKGRKNDNVTAINAVFADFDSTEPTNEALAALPNPSIVVRSKNGLHLYWLVSEGMPLTYFEGIQKRLAQHLGSDPSVCDLARVMRLPGSWHQKDDDRFPVKLLSATGDRHDWKLFDRVLPALTVETKKESKPRSKPKGSQSEVFKALIGSVATADTGQKNSTLNKVAWEIGIKIEQGKIDRAYAEKELLAAAISNGWPEDKAKALIDRKIEEGIAKSASEPRSKVGKIHKWLENILRQRLKFNSRTGKLELDRSAVDLADLYDRIVAKEMDADIPYAAFERHSLLIAKQNKYDPILDYLESLPAIEASETKLIHTLASDLLGDTEAIANTMLAKTLIAAVARIYRPGCKVDTQTVLYGLQGLKKTTLWETLAGEQFFITLNGKDNHKDQCLKIRSKWFVEYGEIETAFKAKDISEIKSYLSERYDTYRPPYERDTVEQPRSCIFVGSTNKQELLNDPTGSRRFWMIEANKEIDLEWVKANRDQLWAEAKALFFASVEWWLPKEDERLAAERNQTYEDRDPLSDAFLDGLGKLLEKHFKLDQSSGYGFTLDELGECLLGQPKGSLKPTSKRVLTEALKEAGWKQERIRRSAGGNQVRVYAPEFVEEFLAPDRPMLIAIKQELSGSFSM